MTATIADHADVILEMDIATGQLLLGREKRFDAAHQIWIRGSALDIPLGDDSIEGAVCVRLSHHLYSQQERERLLTELLRVARRFVVFHYVDGQSPRYLFRALRSRFSGGKGRRNWMTRDEIRTVVQRHGARIIADVPARPLQPHRYVLIERSG
ncbi:MAG: class I SAM-dependent methyltransferase [Rhodocyclaceae bacterium]|nr:class I SAM-dependent methyltransferase [Rhodocyclaceae bacterium]